MFRIDYIYIFYAIYMLLEEKKHILLKSITQIKGLIRRLETSAPKISVLLPD